MKSESINLKDNQIIVNIIGRSASGKTTIQEIIEKALIENGFKVKCNYDINEVKNNIEDKVFTLLSKDTEIELNEIIAYKII